MRAAPEAAGLAPRVIARKSLRFDIGDLPSLRPKVADEGEFRVNFIWDRPLVAEPPALAQARLFQRRPSAMSARSQAFSSLNALPVILG